MEKWVHSIEQHQLQGLWLCVAPTDLPSTFLRCHEFTRIQKAVVGQISSESPNGDHDLSHLKGNVASWCIQGTFCHMLDHNLIKKWLLVAMTMRRWQFRTTVQMSFWVYFSAAYETFVLKLLVLDSSTGFSGRLFNNFKWMGFGDCSSLVTVNLWWWPLCSSSCNLSFHFQTPWSRIALYSH